ncbi:MAG: WD40 repeat domain-containing protein [Gemmatales bacterium]|nr:WD40 repeat domain-containing protein [Gemmatales bacterium]MDW8223772.1 WD40 repeat domain-containing protein [Gemmatales bacterium]
MKRWLLTWIGFAVIVFCSGRGQPASLPPIQPDQARIVVSAVGLQQPVLSLVVAGERGPILTITEQGMLQRWTTPQLAGVRLSDTNPATQLNLDSLLTAATQTPDGSMILGAADGKLYILRPGQDALSASNPGHQGAVRALSNGGDTWIASGGEDGQVILWERATFQAKLKWPAHQDWLSALALDEKTKLIASAGYDLAVRLWQLDNGQRIREFSLYPPDKKPTPDTFAAPAVATCVAFSPEGKFLAAGCLDGNIRLWEVSNGNLIRLISAHGSQVTALIFHPSGQVLISASRDRTIRLWNMANGQLLRTLEGHQSWVQALALIDQGTRLVSAGMDGTVRVWDLRAPPK